MVCFTAGDTADCESGFLENHAAFIAQHWIHGTLLTSDNSVAHFIPMLQWPESM